MKNLTLILALAATALAKEIASNLTPKQIAAAQCAAVKLARA